MWASVLLRTGTRILFACTRSGFKYSLVLVVNRALSRLPHQALAIHGACRRRNNGLFFLGWFRLCRATSTSCFEPNGAYRQRRVCLCNISHLSVEFEERLAANLYIVVPYLAVFTCAGVYLRSFLSEVTMI
ncbi:hypothetical protein BKA82DRAFT_626795 [Pisolithus tinctorius]|uniref:Uncharacterized protein n=1 Tax=Pisolithus tinctorius Marx 270 TaxID=870435 RepID=A0A0C3NQW6_PISTI|nr:hypothetical protein BKA82DRAFT_626795 [Pisolithus tinctorius]KIO03255.1 hypothetical protein M404DRAFT_626795 [Pisolithus tinctorius Marx 270]